MVDDKNHQEKSNLKAMNKIECELKCQGDCRERWQTTITIPIQVQMVAEERGGETWCLKHHSRGIEK